MQESYHQNFLLITNVASLQLHSITNRPSIFDKIPGDTIFFWKLIEESNSISWILLMNQCTRECDDIEVYHGLYVAHSLTGRESFLNRFISCCQKVFAA